MRKSLPQMLTASIVIRSESGDSITTPIIIEAGIAFSGGDRPRENGSGIGAPLSDLITIEAVNI